MSSDCFGFGIGILLQFCVCSSGYQWNSLRKCCRVEGTEWRHSIPKDSGFSVEAVRRGAKWNSHGQLRSIRVSMRSLEGLP